MINKQKIAEHVKRRHKHYVIVSGIFLTISCILFGFELLGIATGLGVTGTIVLMIADL